MLEAVMWFAAITAIGELLILHNMPRFRGWVLRSSSRTFALHVGFAALNLWIHWGTMTGTMTGVTAFIVSWAVCHCAKVIYDVRKTT